jgi:hypothetical protein
MTLFKPGDGNDPMYYYAPVGRVGISLCWDWLFSDVSIPFSHGDSKIDVLAISTSWVGNNTGYSYFSKAATDLDVYVAVANQNYSPDSGISIYPYLSISIYI